MNMSPLPLLLLALCVLPTAAETFDAKTVDKKLSTIYERLGTGLSSGFLTVEQEFAVVNNQVQEVLEHVQSLKNAEIISDQVVDVEQVETLKNATAQLLGVLNTVKSRQAASSAVQVFMALAFLAYLGTIAVIAVTKRCKKVSERQRQREFERLEMQLRSSKAKRRAAAAQEKSAQAHSLE